MNILVITRELPPVGGGAGHVAWHLSQALSKDGKNVTIITMGYDNLPAIEEKNGITIYRVDCHRKHQDSSYLLEMLLFLFKGTCLSRRLQKEITYDIVHAHSIVPDGLIACMVPRGSKNCQRIITAHGSDVPGYNPDKFQLHHMLASPLWFWAIYRNDIIVSPSRFLLNLIKKRSKRAWQKTVVIPNGISINTFSKKTKNGSFLIVSRLVKRKNVHLFLESLKQIDTPIKVNIVGEGPMLAKLQETAQHEKLLKHQIVFHGWLQNLSPEWKRLYEESSYFVFLSEQENFPVILLEAQLARMMLLVSNIPGNCEVVSNNAVFPTALTIKDIANKIEYLNEYPPNGVKKIGAENHSYVANNFSWQIVLRMYTEIMKKR